MRHALILSLLLASIPSVSHAWTGDLFDNETPCFSITKNKTYTYLVENSASMALGYGYVAIILRKCSPNVPIKSLGFFKLYAGTQKTGRFTIPKGRYRVKVLGPDYWEVKKK